MKPLQGCAEDEVEAGAHGARGRGYAPLPVHARDDGRAYEPENGCVHAGGDAHGSPRHTAAQKACTPGRQ
jgi:hypothetical protein